MKTRTTIFDIRISDITSVLKVALNGDAEHPVEERYVKAFCERVVNSMWRCVSGAIATMELYGDAEGFIFNMGGYIDAMYDMDEVRWKGFSDKQVDELERCYPQVVQLFREVALDIIEMYLRCMVPYDIELAAKYIENSPHGTFRNMEHIAWECRNDKLTAVELYDIFLVRARKLMHYKENE